MKIKKTITKEVSITESVICDSCDKKISKDLYSADEVRIERVTGSTYPDGGYGKRFKPDICPDCFDNKIMPLITSALSLNPVWEEWDY